MARRRRDEETEGMMPVAARARTLQQTDDEMTIDLMELLT